MAMRPYALLGPFLTSSPQPLAPVSKQASKKGAGQATESRNLCYNRAV